MCWFHFNSGGQIWNGSFGVSSARKFWASNIESPGECVCTSLCLLCISQLGWFVYLRDASQMPSPREETLGQTHNTVGLHILFCWTAPKDPSGGTEGLCLRTRMSMPSSHCMTVALIFHLQTVFGVSQQKPLIRGKSVLARLQSGVWLLCVNCSKIAEAFQITSRLNIWNYGGLVGELRPMRAQDTG